MRTASISNSISMDSIGAEISGVSKDDNSEHGRASLVEFVNFGSVVVRASDRLASCDQCIAG